MILCYIRDISEGFTLPHFIEVSVPSQENASFHDFDILFLICSDIVLFFSFSFYFKKKQQHWV
jgi:hypothetical protein